MKLYKPMPNKTNHHQGTDGRLARLVITYPNQGFNSKLHYIYSIYGLAWGKDGWMILANCVHSLSMRLFS